MPEEDIKKYKPISDSIDLPPLRDEQRLGHLLMTVILLFCRVKFAKSFLCLNITLPVPKQYSSEALFSRSTDCKYAKHAEVPFFILQLGQCWVSISLVKVHKDPWCKILCNKIVY